MRLLDNAIPDQMLGIKDINSINIYCSKAFANALGVLETDVIGKHFCTNHILDIVTNEDQLVFKTRKLHAFLKIYKFHNIIKPLIFIKSPIINPDTKNVIGLFLQVLEYSIAKDFRMQVCGLYNIFATKEKELHNIIKLTKREKQVVFFFLAHLSSQEIADMLYQLEKKPVTKSTIDSIFTDGLYLKFNVTNRVALHKKLLELGYDKFIPQEVLVSGSMPIEAIKVY